MKKTLLLIVGLFAFQANVMAQYKDKDCIVQQTYTSPNIYQTVKVAPTKGTKVKNVILMIGDGMGLQHMYTAWSANKGALNLENCMYTGLSKTYCANRLITDSGAAGTAMAIGAKANYHSVGLSASGERLPSLTDLAHEKGLGTGVVVNCGLTDATPAAFAAKNADRDQEEDLALDYLNAKIDFVFGGDNEKFIKRRDGRDLLKELSKSYQICQSWDETAAVKSGRSFTVIGDGQLPLALDRGTLWQDASMKAIEVLDQNPNGFFLMLEGSRIDDCGHWNSLPRLVEEIFDFDQAVGRVLQWAEKNGETLVIVLSDHETGALTLTGGDKNTGEITVHFANTDHSGVMVPIYAYGPKSEKFTGMMENTDIFKKIKSILGL